MLCHSLAQICLVPWILLADFGCPSVRDFAGDGDLMDAARPPYAPQGEDGGRRRARRLGRGHP